MNTSPNAPKQQPKKQAVKSVTPPPNRPAVKTANKPALKSTPVPQPKRNLNQNLSSKKEKTVPKKKMREQAWWEDLIDSGAEAIKHLAPVVLGMGDYELDEPSLSQQVMPESNSLLAIKTKGKLGATVPYMHDHGETCRIPHREYLGDVYSNTLPFATTTYVINPGMNETFPWASPIANQYTCYRILGMVAEFVSEGSDYSNAAGLGYVALGTQYNSADPPFDNKRTMLNSQFSCAEKPSNSFDHWIECKPNLIPVNELYTRAGNLPANTDIRMYDHGKLTIAVGGNTISDAIIGELWITYDIELMLPKTSDSIGSSIISARYDCTGCTNAGPFGTDYTKSTNSTFELAFTGNTMTFPANVRGRFKVTIESTSAANIVFNAPLFSSTSSTISNTFYAPTNGATTTKTSSACNIVVTKDNSLLTWSGAGVIYSGASICSVLVTQLPNLSLDKSVVSKSQTRWNLSREKQLKAATDNSPDDVIIPDDKYVISFRPNTGAIFYHKIENWDHSSVSVKQYPKGWGFDETLIRSLVYSEEGIAVNQSFSHKTLQALMGAEAHFFSNITT